MSLYSKVILLSSLFGCAVNERPPTLVDNFIHPTFTTKHGIRVYDLVYSGIHAHELEFMVDMVFAKVEVPKKDLSRMRVFFVDNLSLDGVPQNGLTYPETQEMYIVSAFEVGCHPATSFIHHLTHYLFANSKEKSVDDISHMHPDVWYQATAVQIGSILTFCNQNWWPDTGSTEEKPPIETSHHKEAQSWIY